MDYAAFCRYMEDIRDQASAWGTELLDGRYCNWLLSRALERARRDGVQDSDYTRWLHRIAKTGSDRHETRGDVRPMPAEVRARYYRLRAGTAAAHGDLYTPRPR